MADTVNYFIFFMTFCLEFCLGAVLGSACRFSEFLVLVLKAFPLLQELL